MTDDLASWAERLEQTIRAKELELFDRVFVLTETASTQDAAVRLACGTPGAIVMAGRQVAGRGRLGRNWHGDGALAITFALDSAGFSVAQMSLAGGLAAARTIEQAIPDTAFRAAIRWPNDVVEPLGAGASVRQARKLSGMLVEVSGPLALVGIGINVLQELADWPPDLAGRAVSLRQLGSTASRLDVAERLMIELARGLGTVREELCAEWRERNMLQGRHAAFLCRGQRFDGVVESLTPDLEIVVRSADGILHRLSAAQTSLVQEV